MPQLLKFFAVVVILLGVGCGEEDEVDVPKAYTGAVAESEADDTIFVYKVPNDLVESIEFVPGRAVRVVLVGPDAKFHSGVSRIFISPTGLVFIDED